jgi:hypothetical protein
MGGTTDLSSVRVPIDWDQRREALEAIVQPLLSAKRTAVRCLFKGRKRYLNGVTDAVIALHYLYKVEAARKTGDIDAAIEAAFAFGRYDCESEHFMLFGEHAIKALAGRARGRGGARKAAAVTNEAHEELRPQYQRTVEALMGDGRTSYTAACEQVAASLGVSGRTVRDNTVNPRPRNRGRWPR